MSRGRVGYLALVALASFVPVLSGKTLDNFDSTTAWTAFASDAVKASLRQVDGTSGKALCLDYDFNGVSGYAVARRMLPMDYPGNYEYSIRLRGDAPANNLEFKLTDATGENVWWVTKPNYVPPAEWTPITLKKRQIGFAWGPGADKTLRHSKGFEITISAGKGGGHGEVCFDDLGFRELPAEDSSPLVAARISRFEYDLGSVREFGGLTLVWSKQFASEYAIELSDDSRTWREVSQVHGGNGGNDWIALPDSETRYVRLKIPAAHRGDGVLSNLTVEPLAFSASPNAFLQSVASASPRGQFPRGFSGEQPYWTIVGIDGGRGQGLIGEDGAVEFAQGGPSVVPMVISDGKLVTWADVTSTQSLAEGYLPIPSAQWRHRDFGLRVTALARGDVNQSQMLVRYRLDNPTHLPHDYVLALTVQPYQVNPPSQFLNTAGGFSSIRDLAIAGRVATIDGRTRVFSMQVPDRAFASTFDAGMVDEHLFANRFPPQTQVSDNAGLASGAMLYRLRLAPGETREVDLLVPLSGDFHEPGAFDAQAAQDQVAAQWREKLGRMTLRVPAQGQALLDSLRTAVANMLISRSGPRLQPGTRSYARAWIRDGAMINEALLRTGHDDVSEQFLRWFAPYQFASGKVPCCVDDRGSDPVPENDSQGELIYAIAEQYRYGGNRELLAAMWPHVQGAVRYMDQLRLSERTGNNPMFRGLMPASISHEGYSAKPMHSYWDDFWSLRGYGDAVEIAQWLGHDDDAKKYVTARDQFRTDLYASLQLSAAQHQIDFLPGAAELGDFDATSTTIALAPGGEQDRLPQALLHNTFERYWREFVERRDGKRAWNYYTPYELRTVGAFVRLGWRDRASELLKFFLADQQPVGWKQWAEVVAREPRKPFFLGDLPHAWVASDYVRSVLDMFAYVRDSDAALVIAAGIPNAWLDGDGIAVGDLRTPYGKLSYTLHRDGKIMRLHIDAGLQLPPGGIVFLQHAGESRIRKLPADMAIDTQ